MKRFDTDNMYKQITLPVSKLIANNRFYKSDPHIFDNYVVKQACCTGMPSGEDFKDVSFILPSTDKAKLRNGEYEEILVRVTKDDCSKLSAAGTGYNLNPGQSSQKCTKFGNMFCKNLKALNKNKATYLRKGRPLGATVEDDDTGRGYDPGQGHFCSCMLARGAGNANAAPQCTDAFCSEHGTSAAGVVYKSDTMRKNCNMTICQQDINIQDVTAAEFSAENFMLEQKCGPKSNPAEPPPVEKWVPDSENPPASSAPQAPPTSLTSLPDPNAQQSSPASEAAASAASAASEESTQSQEESAKSTTEEASSSSTYIYIGIGVVIIIAIIAFMFMRGSDSGSDFDTGYSQGYSPNQGYGYTQGYY